MQEKLIEAQVCKNCNSKFDITDKDLEFYDKISPTFNGVKYSIPTPTICPDCRQQKRLAIGNEEKMYKRKCSGCGKNIISIYSEHSNLEIYCPTCRWSDKGDGMQFGIEYNFDKLFFEQFNQINIKIPKLSILNVNSENCEFNNGIFNSKNCYLSFGNTGLQDCFYCYANNGMKDCIDCWWSAGCSMCYECSNNTNLYKCNYCFNSANLNDCHFCNECVGCEYCIMCYGLTNKKYCIQNKQYTKQEFEKEKQNIFSIYSNMIKTRQMSYEFFEKQFHKYISSINSENSYGDYIYNSKQSIGYNIVNIEDGKYIYECGRSKDVFDSCFVYDCEGKIFESNNIVGSFNILFSKNCVQGTKYCIYSQDMINCQECFGCSGLRNKQFCILNKQYSKEEYNILVPKIIELMKKNGERGEFFPISISTFGYNETIAQDYFTINKEIAEKNGYKRQGIQYFINIPQGIKYLKNNEIPDSINDLTIDLEKQILESAIICEITGKPFRIIKNELEFYKKNSIPIPRRGPEQRHFERMQYRNPRKLFKRKCDKCSVDIKTTYAPGRPEIVYCENCYIKEVY